MMLCKAKVCVKMCCTNKTAWSCFVPGDALLPRLLAVPSELRATDADRLPQGLQVEVQPRASVALPGEDVGSGPEGHAPAGKSVAAELRPGVGRGLRQEAAQEHLCLLLQGAGGEEEGLPDQEKTRETEEERATRDGFCSGRFWLKH